MNIQSVMLPVSLMAAALVASVTMADNSPYDFERLRKRMVAKQLVTRGISDPAVLRAMTVTPRHLFVPEQLKRSAYEDGPLPIGYQQTISQPYIVALMSELMALKPKQRVLEIGTGSGYQAAILAEMGAQVFTIEIIPELGRQAQQVIADLGYANIHVKIGDGYQGWPEQAPFDAVIVTCAPTHIPEPLKAQLAEGGRMVVPVGGSWVQRLVLLTKQKGRIKEEKVLDVRFVPMMDERGKPY